MDLAKQEKLENQKRFRGIIIGAISPVLLLLIISVLSYFKIIFERPYLTDDATKLTVGASSLLGIFWIYATSVSFFQAFFSLSINMLLVFLFSSKNHTSMSNGIIVPTAIFALFLVFVRLI